MAWSALKTWIREYLTYQDLNNEFTNVYTKLNYLNTERSNLVIELDNQIDNINSDINDLETSIATNDPLGVVKEYYGTTLPEHYLWADGRTIGNASSGATSLASADAEDLFKVLWESVNNSETIRLFNSSGTSVSKGVSAMVDFAANYRISLPDKRGRAGIGLDNMGGTSANRVVNSNADIMGGTGGTENVTLTTAQMPNHGHGVSLSQPYYGSSNSNPNNIRGLLYGQVSSQYAINISIGSSGSGTAHSNMQPWIACNYIMRY